jgi:hypothetical protein
MMLAWLMSLMAANPLPEFNQCFAYCTNSTLHLNMNSSCVHWYNIPYFCYLNCMATGFNWTSGFTIYRHKKIWNRGLDIGQWLYQTKVTIQISLTLLFLTSTFLPLNSRHYWETGMFKWLQKKAVGGGLAGKIQTFLTKLAVNLMEVHT